MSGLMAGGSLLVSLVMIVAGVFLLVLSIVFMVKVLQIAEDVRYLRSRTDANIPRPKKYTSTLLMCLAIAGGISIFMVLSAAMYAGTIATMFK